jgi:hypothetical protein
MRSMSRRVLWERSDVPGFEWCELSPIESGHALRGIALLAADGVPWRVDYRIELDLEGRTRAVRIEAEGGPNLVVIKLDADGAGHWLQDGEPIISSAAALDVDLGFSPSTNTLPIRRLGLAVGERRDIEVAWVLFPSFEVEHGRQSYQRLDERTWRYRSEGFQGDLVVDEEGLVETYAEWRAVARG